MSQQRITGGTQRLNRSNTCIRTRIQGCTRFWEGFDSPITNVKSFIVETRSKPIDSAHGERCEKKTNRCNTLYKNLSNKERWQPMIAILKKPVITRVYPHAIIDLRRSSHHKFFIVVMFRVKNEIHNAIRVQKLVSRTNDDSWIQWAPSTQVTTDKNRVYFCFYFPSLEILASKTRTACLTSSLFWSCDSI